MSTEDLKETYMVARRKLEEKRREIKGHLSIDFNLQDSEWDTKYAQLRSEFIPLENDSNTKRDLWAQALEAERL